MIAADLRALGLGADDRVVVHSSLRAIGAPADEVVDTLAATVALVVVPTFTYTTASFDPATTPGRTGALAETLRARPRAARSSHPTYSFAALGEGAAEAVAGDDGVLAPLERLVDAGARVLLLGVGHVANTTVHVGERRAGAPYLDIPFDPTWPRARMSWFPGCSRAFAVVEAELRRRGDVRDGRVGGALAQVMPAAAVVAATVEVVRADPAALLCTDPACYRCSTARGR